METSKSNIPSKRKRRKRLSLHLIDDDIHSFEYVNYMLTHLLPLCNTLRAEQLALITHNTGECQIYTGFAPEIYLVYAAFQKSGLDISLREYNNPKSKK